MLRASLLSMLLLATALPLATAAVDPCETYGVCVVKRVEAEPLYACGGVALGTGFGYVACAYDDGAGHPCVKYTFGFRWENLCDAITWDGVPPILP